MFVVKIHYLEDGAVIDKYLQAHRDFLDLHYQQGLLLASGPMTPRVGGILIATGSDKEKLETILKDDPFALAGIANYEIIEFTPVKYHKAIESLIK